MPQVYLFIALSFPFHFLKFILTLNFFYLSSCLFLSIYLSYLYFCACVCFCLFLLYLFAPFFLISLFLHMHYFFLSLCLSSSTFPVHNFTQLLSSLYISVSVSVSSPLCFPIFVFRCHSHPNFFILLFLKHPMDS